MAALALLYSYRRCPYAMRARMALRYAGIAYQVQDISLKDKPPSLLAVSPKARCQCWSYLMDGCWNKVWTSCIGPCSSMTQPSG